MKIARSLGFLTIPFVLALLAAGCAKPPTAEMENAVLAVTRAENDANAVAYGSSSLIRARDALSRMQAEASAKRYEAAKTLAAEAVSAAERAVSDGQAGFARARQEAAAKVNSLRLPLTETENAISAAKQVKNIPLDFDGIDRDYAAAQRTAAEAQTSLTRDDFQAVDGQCQTVRTTLGGINTRLADAAQAVSRKK